MSRFHLALGSVFLLAAFWLPKTASAVTNCTASATPLAFGTVAGGSNVDASGIVTVVCNTSALAATVRVRMCLNIGAGANGGGQTNPRRMTNSFGDTMQFQIYRNASQTLFWGDSNTPVTPNPVQLDLQYVALALVGGSGSTQAIMYGRVPFQSGLAAGSYTNPFTGAETRLDYRYTESAVLGSYPASCTSGGTGGGSTMTFPFTASATVPNNCVISAATNLDFGMVPGLIDANRDQTSAITFTCTGRTAWNVALNNGQNASGNTRRMRLGASGSHVNYELYRDPGRTQRWGTTAGADTVPGTGTGSQQTLTVYGRVPATQAVPAGSYGDVITVTVTY